ncbi:MAG: CoB--CoM heterodisulfide reductase iron-sulfur subunit A family protein [Candidatus Zhuqueibacterota bacterium]
MQGDNRIGIFLCQCGGLVADVLSLPRIEKAVKKLPGVSHTAIHNYPCSKTGLSAIRSEIQTRNLNRVVIAGCSPRMMASFFENALSEVGINSQLIDIVNIRDFSAAVHRKEKSLATTKAIGMVRAAAARLAVKQPLPRLSQKVNPVVAVIGGGIAGISAALSLAHQGVTVKLLEKSDALGGFLNYINILYPREILAREFLQEKLEQIKQNPNIEVITGAEIQEVAGSVGNYRIGVSKQGERTAIDAGAIVLATGSHYFYPNGLYEYGADERVITQLEFEQQMSRDAVTARDLVFIQCVGSRNEQRPYCSRFCCPETFKNVLHLKRKTPGLNVTVIFRGLTEYIREYDEAVERGVQFIRYAPANPPQVRNGHVTVKDEKTEREFEVPFDLLILATPQIPHENATSWAKKFHLPVDAYGFIVEPHTKLRPRKFAPEGVFVAGNVHWPGMVGDAIAQGYSAAARAFTLVRQQVVEREPVIARIDEKTCRGCERCVQECPFQAITLVSDGDGFQHAVIDEFICKGCGMCAVVCICGAATVLHLSDAQLQGAAVLG